MQNRFWVCLHPLLFALTLLVSILFSTQEAVAERKGTFTGSWTASGKWQPLEFQGSREVFTFRLTGHVNLENEIGDVQDFWSDCVGLWDSQTGGTSRCVWRDPEGEDVAFIVLNGQLAKKDVEVTAEFVGGSGSLKGLEGSFTFTWSSLFRNQDERVLTGYCKELKGSFRVPRSF